MTLAMDPAEFFHLDLDDFSPSLGINFHANHFESIAVVSCPSLFPLLYNSSVSTHDDMLGIDISSCNRFSSCSDMSLEEFLCETVIGDRDLLDKDGVSEILDESRLVQEGFSEVLDDLRPVEGDDLADHPPFEALVSDSFVSDASQCSFPCMFDVEEVLDAGNNEMSTTNTSCIERSASLLSVSSMQRSASVISISSIEELGLQSETDSEKDSLQTFVNANVSNLHVTSFPFHIMSGMSEQIATQNVDGLEGTYRLDQTQPRESFPFIKVGRYNNEERQVRIQRYKHKRRKRNFEKRVKYCCRKVLADSRPRVRGRFAKY